MRHAIDHEKIKNRDVLLRQRLMGQDQAISKTVNIVKRAVSGLSGLQHSSGQNKPRGVLFFAGPTGTGKTELTKALAEQLFGDENNCIRFDMSEFAESHADQKLFGAPPGYVGYEAGGQLTNAIKERPFSILLFDEIEKAHPSIMDKFLQILEDGRMTDGQGNTVYFSETLIIFTSNLGITQQYVDANGIERRAQLVSPSESYEEIVPKVLDAIKNAGLDSIAVGKITDIFVGQGITETIRTASNAEGMAATSKAAERDFRGLCFTNLVDFDMVYGHRNNVEGYATALTEFDRWLTDFLPTLTENDLLIITADHGCDPATPSTDHSREYTPMLMYRRGMAGKDLGTRKTFADIAATVADFLDVDASGLAGESFLER